MKDTFIHYLSELRKEQNITMEDLCSGLCSKSSYSYFESGKKSMPKSLQDRLLGRLGSTSENCTYLLPSEEYDNWQLRNKIIFQILKEHYSEASASLEFFHNCYTSNLDMQFYYRMYSFIFIHLDHPCPKIVTTIKKALDYTVPDFNIQHINRRFLSIQELDIIADYFWYNKDFSESSYSALLKYVKTKNFDILSKSKIIPKLVFYYIKSKILLQNIEEWSLSDVLDSKVLCDEALELLRYAHSSLYLFETLHYRGLLLHALPSSNNKEGIISRQCMENELWTVSFQWLYEENHICFKTKNSAIIYATENVECISDVIYSRRCMLGISSTDLADGICDVRTIRRLEQKKTRPQHDITIDLLRKLHIPTACTKTDTMVISSISKHSLDKLHKLLNTGKYSEAKFHLANISKDLPQDPYNKQTLSFLHAYFQYVQNEISFSSFCTLLVTILESSVPFEKILSSKEKYFTTGELVLLNQYIAPSSTKAESVVQILEKYFSQYLENEQMINFARTLNVIIDSIQSYYGDIGNYQCSNYYCDKLLESAFLNKNLLSVAGMSYAKWWNKKAALEPVNDSMLLFCFLMANFIENSKEEFFYKNKIKTIILEKNLDELTSTYHLTHTQIDYLRQLIF